MKELACRERKERIEKELACRERLRRNIVEKTICIFLITEEGLSNTANSCLFSLVSRF